jgi:hypothetical protein
MIDEDREIEAVLRRYGVADPPPQLARRIAAGDAFAPGTSLEWVWGPAAAAAVLAAWMALHMRGVEPERDPWRDAEVALVAEALGGGEEAIWYAEAIVPQPPAPTLGPGEEPPW